MDIQALQTVISDQNSASMPSHQIIEREQYDGFEDCIESTLITIITGVRRCGKSTLLKHIQNQLPESDFYVNFDDHRLAAFTVDDFQSMLEILIAQYGDQKTCYFDEIQNIPEWERFIRRLHDSGYKIFITGSNASMLSRELGTRLTGRYLSKTLYPFSFREYLNFKNLDIPAGLSTLAISRRAALLDQYLKDGGFPEHLKERSHDYLHNLYSSILHQDILVRHHITHQHLFKNLANFLASNLGKEHTHNSLRKLLGLSNSSTVSEYCAYLEDAFLCFTIHRYSHSLRRQHGYAKKVYFIDTALALTVGFRISEDQGRRLENIVYLALRRQYRHIFFHREHKECDFIIQENHEITQAIQVCQALNQPNTRAREIEGLVEAMSSYDLDDGLILVQYGAETIQQTVQGKTYTVSVIPIAQWLLENPGIANVK